MKDSTLVAIAKAVAAHVVEQQTAEEGGKPGRRRRRRNTPPVQITVRIKRANPETSDAPTEHP